MAFRGSLTGQSRTPLLRGVVSVRQSHWKGSHRARTCLHTNKTSVFRCSRQWPSWKISEVNDPPDLTRTMSPGVLGINSSRCGTCTSSLCAAFVEPIGHPVRASHRIRVILSGDIDLSTTVVDDGASQLPATIPAGHHTLQALRPENLQQTAKCVMCVVLRAVLTVHGV